MGAKLASGVITVEGADAVGAAGAATVGAGADATEVTGVAPGGSSTEPCPAGEGCA
jgi:hypothetical protein